MMPVNSPRLPYKIECKSRRQNTSPGVEAWRDSSFRMGVSAAQCDKQDMVFLDVIGFPLALFAWLAPLFPIILSRLGLA